MGSGLNPNWCHLHMTQWAQCPCPKAPSFADYESAKAARDAARDELQQFEEPKSRFLKVRMAYAYTNQCEPLFELAWIDPAGIQQVRFLSARDGQPATYSFQGRLVMNFEMLASDAGELLAALGITPEVPA